MFIDKIVVIATKAQLSGKESVLVFAFTFQLMKLEPRALQ